MLICHVVVNILMLVALVSGSRCKDNQFVHEIIDNIYYGESRYECRECGLGQYGFEGQCYACPSFTRERKYKDFDGTLWCDNSCSQMWQNRELNDVEFGVNLDTDKKTTLIFQYKDSMDKASVMFQHRDTMNRAVCAACADNQFARMLKAHTVLIYLKNDLLAMKYTRDQVDRLAGDTRPLQRFTWSICSSCPPGFVQGKWANAVGSRIDEYEGKMIPCKTCAIKDGVPKKQEGQDIMQCTPCSTDQWQQYALVEFIPYTSEHYAWDGSPRKQEVATECISCPAGHQRTKTGELEGEWSVGQCRGHTAAQCCSKCPLNKFKGEQDIACVHVTKDHVAISGENFVDIAATAQRACRSGERIASCWRGSSCAYALTGDWKTCLPCIHDQTTRSSDTSGCVTCSSEQKHIVDPTDSKKCISCSSCHERLVTAKEEPLNVHLGFGLVDATYSVNIVQASCIPLQQRKVLLKEGQVLIEGVDHWRPSSSIQGILLPAFEFLDRSQGLCVKKHCIQACAGRFQYANGCGIDTAMGKTWVQKMPEGTMTQLEKLTASDVADATQWQVLTEGKCQFCTACSAGYHNDGCNQNYGKNPEGSCRACKSSCPSGAFMKHTEKDAGCHDPPWSQNSTESGKFHILEDYTCEQCPTWVRQGNNISIVAACGLQTQYEHFTANVVNGKVQKQFKTVLPQHDDAQQVGGVTRRNFRTFIKNLMPYCPPGFYFKTQSPECTFVNYAQDFELPNAELVGIGYEAYTPQCCEACTDCFAPKNKRDTNIWQQCDGRSLEDTQNKCVEKCVLGYYEDGEQCKRCRTCYDGILSVT